LACCQIFKSAIANLQSEIKRGSFPRLEPKTGGTKVCSIVTSESATRLALAEGDEVYVLFNACSVVVLAD
jgi:molybdopterin-binding protein